MDVVKKIAGVAFFIAFAMAVVLFGKIGTEYISINTARIIFIACGAIGLFLNLISFQTGKHSPIFNFIYWIGSIILFVGLVFLLMKWPYWIHIIIGGMIILGIGIFIPQRLIERKNSETTDLLDNPD